MATKTLTDTHNDLKLLISAISGFQEGEEGFHICERFALSQIKHHRYLSVNSNAVKKEIEELNQKFLIHGKYDVAKEFQDLVKSFLTSFDFDQHPQYDIQWSLLSLLLNLANETNNSKLCSSSEQSQDHSQNITAEGNKSEEIDWVQYLKEGQEDFFCNYESNSDSDEWSDDENVGQLDLSILHQEKSSCMEKMITSSTGNHAKISSNEALKGLSQGIISRNWLKKNIQNNWWNELPCHQYKVDSQFDTAKFYEIWQKSILKINENSGTLSEYQVCRELLWMFYSPSSIIVFKKGSESEYKVSDVSIPSLSTVSFKSMLFSYCEYFKMMREFENFLDKVLRRNDFSDDSHKPPLTFEAYAFALEQEILNIKTALVQFEVELLKQDGQKTLLSMSKSLKVYLEKVRMIFEIHKAVTSNWEKSSNWQCASKLLSTLYFKMENSNNNETINLSANLYLASLSVYLSIVDVWLSEGRLEDWREEFIIYKCTESMESFSREDSRPLEGFALRQLDSLCLKDPIINLLLHKVYPIGRSIELLNALDRISDLWDIMDQEQVTMKSLNEECLKQILLECIKYDSSNFHDSTDSASLKIIEIVPPKVYDSDIEHKIMHQVSVTNNPFLTKALESFISTESSIDSVDAKSINSIHSEEPKESIEKNNIFGFLEKSKYILPWKKIFEYSVTKVLESKFSGASKLVKNILIREYKLEEQLKLMRSVYMMETSHIMNKFCKLIFTEIESNGMWNNSYYITCLLEEILSHEWPNWSSRWSITITNIKTVKVLEAVDGIKLHYAAGWPINMLLSEEALDKYNKIFRFELKLKWALWTLNTLRFTDLENSKLQVVDAIQHFHIRRLESLRFWLLHAVGSIHAYLSGQVLQSLGNMLEKSLAQAANVEAIVTIHNDYLEDVHEHCLQTEKFDDLTCTIYKLLAMCEEIRRKWKPESLAFIGKALDELENDYVKYHTYLALGLHNAVQHKDADYRKSKISHKFLQYVDQIKP